MKKIIFLTLFISLLSFNLKAQELKTYTLDVNDFNELQVIDDINVIHRCSQDSAGFAVFTCTDEFVRSLIFSNNKNKLKIELNTDEKTVNNNDIPTITVYSNFLQSVENFGDSTIYVFSPAPGALFKARVIGNGAVRATGIYATQTEGNLDTGKGVIELEGVTKHVNFKNIGKGSIKSDSLQAETGTITILGTGPVYCEVSSELTVKGMGTGKVYLRGNPKIKKRSLGSISVIELE